MVMLRWLGFDVIVRNVFSAGMMPLVAAALFAGGAEASSVARVDAPAKTSPSVVAAGPAPDIIDLSAADVDPDVARIRTGRPGAMPSIVILGPPGGGHEVARGEPGRALTPLIIRGGVVGDSFPRPAPVAPTAIDEGRGPHATVGADGNPIADGNPQVEDSPSVAAPSAPRTFARQPSLPRPVLPSRSN